MVVSLEQLLLDSSARFVLGAVHVTPQRQPLLFLCRGHLPLRRNALAGLRLHRRLRLLLLPVLALQVLLGLHIHTLAGVVAVVLETRVVVHDLVLVLESFEKRVALLGDELGVGLLAALRETLGLLFLGFVLLAQLLLNHFLVLLLLVLLRLLFLLLLFRHFIFEGTLGLRDYFILELNAVLAVEIQLFQFLVGELEESAVAVSMNPSIVNATLVNTHAFNVRPLVRIVA